MTGGQPWFLGYMLSDPACLRLAGILAAGFFTAIGAGAAMLHVCGRLDDDMYYLDELLDPIRTFHFSPCGEARAYDGCVEIFRGGACVGILHGGIAEAEWSGDKHGRELRVAYADGSMDRVPCGPVGWQEALRVRELAMRYAGRMRHG